VTALTVTLLAVDALLVLYAYRERKKGLLVWLLCLATLFGLTGATGFLVFGSIIAALLLGQPLFVLMGGLAMALLATVSGLSSFEEQVIIVRKLLELASKEVLLAIPFFVVAGEVMTQGSLARRLIEVMKALVGWIPGGLAVAAVAACCFFAAISGSSPVTVVAIGSIMVPALVKAKYPENFAVGLLTSAGSLGILIPPSIPMIVYSIMVSSATPVDPLDLFMAGVGPGLFIGTVLAGYSVLRGYQFKVPREPFSPTRIWQAVREGFWSLLLPAIILGGIYSGTFTATEASAVAVVYALAVELFIHRELDRKKLLEVAEGSMTVMGSLLVIIALAIGLNYFLVDQQVPDRLVEWITSFELTPTRFLVLVNLLLLVVGCLMDIMSAILIVAPMLAPMAAAMGINPVHMGIIFIVNLEIGYLTPPVGLNLFVSSTLFKKGLGWVVKAVVPTVLLLLASLMVITWWPGLSLTLVDVFKATPAAMKTVEPTAPVKVNEPLPDGKVKSLEELMRAAKQDAGSPPPRVKSLEELMREAKGRKAAEDADGGSLTPP
jgi:C4-dicarboxylate transporter DctM subunit